MVFVQHVGLTTLLELSVVLPDKSTEGRVWSQTLDNLRLQIELFLS